MAKKKKSNLSDAQYQKMYGRPKDTSNKAGTKTKSQSSVSNKKTSKPISSGFTVGYRSPKANANNTSRSTSTSRNVTSQDRINQKSYGATRRGVAPTATSRQRTTPATSAEMRRQNAAANNNLKQTQAERSRNEQKQRFNTAKEMMAARAEEGRKQKMGAEATAEQKTVARRAIKNTPSLVKKAALDAGEGHLKTIADVTEMTASNKNGVQAKAMKMGIQDDPRQMRKLEKERAETVKQAKAERERLQKKQDKRQEEWDEKSKGAKGLEKAYYGALESGVGMATDAAIGLGTPVSLAAMGSRTYGSTRGQAQKEGATEKEDRLYSLLQAGKEVGTELMFPGAGLAKKAYGRAGLPLAEKAANALTRNLRGTTADVTRAGIRLLGGTAEENIEEIAGWGLDPLIKEFAYGRNVRERDAKEVMYRISEDMRSKIQNEQDASSATAYLSSDTFLEQTKQDYIAEGLSESDAEEVAEKMRDFLTASLTGDTETMARLEDEVSKKVAGGSKLEWDWKELGDTIASTTLLTMTTGLPGTITTASRGAAIRDELGEDGVRALANTAIDFEDETDSYKGQAAKDRIDSGKELTSTQVYDLAEAMQKQTAKDSERQAAAVDSASKVIKNENLVTPYGVNQATGVMQMDDVTAEQYDSDAKAASKTIKAYESTSEGSESLTDTELRNGSRAIAGFKSGIFTIEDANELNFSNTAVRSAFEEETGVDLGQYVVKDKSGKVNIPATNAATKDALFAMASENLVESARVATVNWMDNVKGEVVSQVTARMGSEGSVAFQVALDDVDERNRSEYMMVANASDMLYQRGLNMGTEWENVKDTATKMFPQISEAKLKAMYDAGLADRDIATDEYRGKSVRMGEAISSMSESDRANVTGKVFVDTELAPKGTIVRAFSELASNLGVDIHLVDNLPTDSGQQANGLYHKGEIYINVNSSFEQNMGYIFMHEVTHHLKEYAPEEYAALENLVREKWFEYDDAQMQNEIAKKIDLYNRATEGKQTLTEAEALEEIIADAAHEFINDPNFANQVAEENPNLAKAVLNSIRNALRMLRRVLATGSIDDETHMNDLFSQLDIFDEAEKLWLNAYTAAYQNKAALAINNWQDAVNRQYRYSNSKTVNADSQELKGLSDDERISTAKTHAKSLANKEYTLKDSNGNDVSVKVVSSKRFKNRNGTSKAANKDFINKYIKNKNKQESIMLLDEIVESAEYVGASKPKYGHDWIDNYGKSDWEYWSAHIQDNEGNTLQAVLNITTTASGEKVLYDIDIKKEEQAINTLATSTSKHSLADTSGDVNSLSEQQDADYMKAVESGDMETAQRMVDEAAAQAMPNTKTPGRWFHGTENEFTEFDFSQGGKNGTAEGFGIYLAKDRDVSEHYGKRMIEGYVNIEHPASSSERTLTKDDLVKLISATVDQEAERLSEDYDSVDAAKLDTWISNYTYTYDKSLEDSISEVADNILRMNENDMEIVQEVMGGMAISRYEEASAFYDILTNLTGIDGFTTTWENQALEGTRDIALAFRSEQIKDSSPVTYDDEGNVIPLSQRFDMENPDIRYSLPTQDADGKILSDGQMDYFKNSQARDEQGRLVRCYRRTRIPGTELYDKRMWFYSDRKDVAQSYVDSVEGESILEYEDYLNITNPLILNCNGAFYYDLPFSEAVNAQGEAVNIGDTFEESTIWDAPNTNTFARIGRSRGYDGIIFRNIRDSGVFAEGEQPTSTVYVTFDSSQMRGVDNLNPTENPDIRYSISDEDEAKSKIAYEDAIDNSFEALEYYEQRLADLTDEAAENRPIRKFNEDRIAEFYAGLKADDSVPYSDYVLEEDRVRMAKSKNDYFNNINAKWNDRWTTEGEVLNVKSVKTDVRNLIMGVMSNSDTDSQYKRELVNKTLFDIRTAYQLMKQDRPEVASALLYHSAQRMIDNVEFYVDGTFDQYKELKDYLRNTRISIGEEYWADVEYDAFRKRNFGRMKLVKGKTNVDQIYQQLEEMFPEWFNEEEAMDVPSQLLEIEHVLDSVQPYKEAYSSEAAAELAFDIADDLYEIMVNGDEVRSLADTYKQRYDEKTKAMKQRHAEAMLRVRRARDEGIQAERAKFREYKEKQREKATHRKEFDSIQKSYDKLTKRLLDNTKDSHIPEQYKKELAAVLSGFDFQTNRSKNIEAKRGYKAQGTIKLEAMRTALERIEENSQLFHVNDAITDIMKELLGMYTQETGQRNVDGLTLDELNYVELEKIDKLLKSLVYEFNNYEKVKTGAKKQQAADIGHAQNDIALEHFKMFGPGKDYQTPLLQGMDEIINLDMMTPAYLFRRIDPNNEGLGLMWKELRRGFDKYVRNTAQLNEWIEEIVGQYHEKGKVWSKYGSGELSEWRLERSQKTFNLEHGATISLTPAQMMSIYCLAKRTQALGHMTKEGIVISPVSFNAKMLSDVKKKANKAQAIPLTDEDIKMIATQLTPEQITVANKLQELMSTKMAEWGNEASMNVLGIRLFEEKDYFPIRSDKASLTKDLDPNQFEQALRSFGFTKAVKPGAGNAIMVDDIFDVVVEHCNNMNLYNSYTEAVNDFMKVYNYKEERAEGSYPVERALRQAYSDKVPTFILQFLKDLNGNVSKRKSGMETLYNSMLANAKKGSVFVNWRVAAQQPTAIERAFYVIDRKYLEGVNLADIAKNATPFVTAEATREMWEHCPIALWKSWGYYDINMGKNIEDIIMNNGNVLDDFATSAYGKLDNLTWTAIWQMVKNEMKDTNPDVEIGTDEYWELCNERMTEIIDLTQVVDSPMHRSHGMRDKGFWNRMTTSFMAEPTLTFNMVRDGLQRTEEARKRGKYKMAAKILTRTASVYVMQTIAVSIAQALVDALRYKNPDNDDEDDRFLHLFWVNFIENFKDEINPLGKIYVVKDVRSLAQGWENRNLALQGVEKLVLGYRQLQGDPYARSSTPWYFNMADGLGLLYGVPVPTMRKGIANMMRRLGLESPVLNATLEQLDEIPDQLKERKEEKMAGESLASSSVDVKESKLVSNGKGIMGMLLTKVDKEEAASSDSKKKSSDSKDEGEDAKDPTQRTREEERDKLRELEKKAKEKAEGLSGSELDEALWDVLSDGYTKELDAGNLDYIEHLELIYMNAGGDTEVFRAKIKEKIASSYKKSFKDEMSQEELYDQDRMRHYMEELLDYSDEEVSEICYKTNTARDLKVAFRLNNEEYINNELSVLVRAGLSDADLDKLYKNRNRLNLKTYSGKYKDKLKSTGNYVFPVDGIITSDFGHRSSPGGIGSTNHQGIDIGASQGTPVAAADGGVVVMAGWYGGYGKTVQVKHDDGTITQYSHLSWWDVKEGDTVAQGQEVGLVGSTGNSTGPHLHFGVLKNGEYVDPKSYINTADKKWDTSA